MKFHGVEQVYSDTGIDLTLLRSNLSRSFEDRWRGNLSILNFASAVRPTEIKMAEFDAASLIRKLVDGQVDFVLIGGVAMIAQGSAFVTKDLDICYSRDPPNIARIASVLADIHPYMRGAPAGLPFKLDAATIQAGANFTLVTDFGDIDLLGHVTGLGEYLNVAALAEDRSIFGMSIKVLSLDGLIAAKRAAGRLKDRNHLLELEELKKLRDRESEQGAQTGMSVPP